MHTILEEAVAAYEASAFWASFDAGYDRLSGDAEHRSRAELAIVIPVTATRRDLPSHIEIEPGDSGLKHVSYNKTEDVNSIPTNRLIQRLGVIPADRLNRTEQALRLLLGL